MKKYLLMLALLLPMMASAMKIEKDVVDEFTGDRVLTTSWESFDKGRIHMRFRLEANYYHLDFKYICDGAIVIREGSKLMFKSTTDSIAQFSSVATYTGGRGDGAVGLAGSSAWGIYASYIGDIYWFTNNVAKLMRVNTAEGYVDKKISENDGYKLQKLALLVQGAVTGDATLRTMSCTLQYMKKKKSKNEWEIVNEEYLKNALYDEVMGRVNEWKGKSDDQYDYDVKIVKDK